MIYFLIALIISIFITPIIIHIYHQHQWLDDPHTNEHIKNTHQKPVPRGGGLVIFFSTMIPAALFLNVDKYLLAILISALILTITGFFDDIYNIHPLIRLLTGSIATLIIIASGIGVAYISNPLKKNDVIQLDQPRITVSIGQKERQIWVLSTVFTFIYTLWNMNIINWSKGVDGQLPGFVSISLVFIAILANRYDADPTQFNVKNLSLIVSGAYTGLLIWNWKPQKIMPGYGAGSLAGFFLSILSIISGAKIATTLMVLAIPTADGIFTIFRRILAGKSPIWGDRGHLHHKLIDDLNWSKSEVAIFYWLTSLGLGLMSLFLNSFGKLIAITLTSLFVFSFMIIVKINNQK